MAVVFNGPVEVDEGLLRRAAEDMGNARRKELKAEGMGQGPKGKTVVVAAKDRKTKQVTARVVERRGKATAQGFTEEHTVPSARVYMDAGSADDGLEKHESVKHSVGE